MAELVIKLVNGELAGKTMQDLTKQISTAARELKKAEIGTKEWVAANEKLNHAKDLQADLKKQIESTTSASDKLKAAWNKLPGAHFFNDIAESFGLMKGGVGGLVSSFGVLKTAIAATGIGLLVVVLGSLYTWFTKTEEGADKLKSVMYPLQVLFQKFTGIVAELGGNIFKRFSAALNNPMQALKDLGQAIYDNVLKRFEALGKFGPAIVKIFSGEIVDGFKDLGNATIQVATGVEDGIGKIQDAGKAVADIWDDAYDKGQQLLNLENSIEDAEAELVKTRARLNVEFKTQADIAKDVSKSNEERLDAAHKAEAIQDRLAAAEEAFLKLKLRRLILEQDLDHILTDDEKLERAKMEAELIQLQADNIQKKMEVAAVAHSIEKKQATDKANEAKKEVELQKKIEGLKIEAMKDGYQKQQAEIFRETDEKIAALTGTEEQRKEQEKLLIQIRNQEIDALWEKHNEEQEKREEEARKKKEEEDAKAHDDEIKRLEALARKKQALQDSEQDLANSFIVSYIDGISRQNAASDERLQRIKEQQGEESSAYKQALEENEALRKKNAEKQRRAEKLALSINVAAEISSIWKNAAEFGPAGPIIGALQTAAALIRYHNGLKNIDAAKYEKGGLLRGPRHSQGGIPIEAEGGEFIFSRKAVKAIGADRLVAVNNFYTRKFAAGGPVDPFTDTRTPGTSVGPAFGDVDISGLIAAQDRRMAELIAAQDRRIDRLKVINVLTETESGIKTLNRIRYDADV